MWGRGGYQGWGVRQSQGDCVTRGTQAIFSNNLNGVCVSVAQLCLFATLTFRNYIKIFF